MQAAETPGALAVEFAGEQLTYAELNERANQLAHQLRALGVGPEVLVGLCVERSLELVIGMLGILKAGGAYVPLDPSYPLRATSVHDRRRKAGGDSDTRKDYQPRITDKPRIRSGFNPWL